jgi:hypothetical protein
MEKFLSVSSVPSLFLSHLWCLLLWGKFNLLNRNFLSRRAVLILRWAIIFIWCCWVLRQLLFYDAAVTTDVLYINVDIGEQLQAVLLIWDETVCRAVTIAWLNEWSPSCKNITQHFEYFHLCSNWRIKFLNLRGHCNMTVYRNGAKGTTHY